MTRIRVVRKRARSTTRCRRNNINVIITSDVITAGLHRRQGGRARLVALAHAVRGSYPPQIAARMSEHGQLYLSHVRLERLRFHRALHPVDFLNGRNKITLR